MPLDATRLANAVYARWTGDTARNGFSSPLTTSQQAVVRSLIESLTLEILNEITGHAVVTASGTGGSVTGTVS